MDFRDIADLLGFISYTVSSFFNIKWLRRGFDPLLMRLAEKHSLKAELIENAGYQRVAQSLRDIADDCRQQADRI